MKHLALPALLLVLLLTAPDASAQRRASAPRFGLGANLMLSTADGLGLGFRGRASAPVNADLSLAADLGFTAFVLEGRRNGSYVFDPQASAIITLPSSGSQLAYILAGVGAYIPTGNEDEGKSGPTLHAGIGWVRQLNETSLYYEIDPALVVGETAVYIAIPVRLGVIF